jgi:phospholipid/cholesterol/gamma-HCH transport system substrate-binding protein
METKEIEVVELKRFEIELLVGFFMVVGFLAILYLAVKIGSYQFYGQSGYKVYASFNKTGGVKSGAAVEIAGVPIGKIRSITLDNETYEAVTELQINQGIKLQEDAIASIKTKGLLGEKFIQITPGGSDAILKNGGRIRETESAVDIEELISKYAFGDVKSK